MAAIIPSHDLRQIMIRKSRAAAMLARLFLSDPLLELLVRGDVNTTYLASSKNGKRLIIRIADKQRYGHRCLPAFIKAAKATKRVRAAGLPAPEILLTGEALVPYAYQVIEFIDGQTAADFKGSQHKIWKQLGALAYQINQLKPLGMGEEPFTKPRQSWRDFFSNNLDEVLAFHRAPSREFVKEGHAFEDWELDIIEKHLRPLQNIKPDLRLVHSDLGPHNIIVDSRGKIKAVIDWDGPKAFPAEHQVAVCTFWQSDPEDKAGQKRLKAFLEGYGQDIDFDLVRSFQIYEFLTQLPFHTHKRALARLLRIVSGIDPATALARPAPSRSLASAKGA